MSSFEFRVVQYVVGMAWSNEIRDFNSIVLWGDGPPSSRMLGTIYFFSEGSQVHQPASTRVGYFRSPTRFYATLIRSDFEAFYAILRSERPLFLRGGGTGDSIEYMELHTNSEPVGEVDTTPGVDIVVGTGEVIRDIDAIARGTR